MNIARWLDKYRIAIGIILIIIIAVGIIFLFWGNKITNANKKDNSNITILESKISELEAKISKLEESGQVAGEKSKTQDVGEIEEKNEQQIEKININTAGLSELERLPEVGPVRAKEIINYRETHSGFKTTAEIQNIKGIGPKTYEQMKDMIIIE